MPSPRTTLLPRWLNLSAGYSNHITIEHRTFSVLVLSLARRYSHQSEVKEVSARAATADRCVPGMTPKATVRIARVAAEPAH